MKTKDLLENFNISYYKNFEFHMFLNEIASYVMYEQAIVKKDNDIKNPIINYVYDEYSYKWINTFFSEVVFLSEPVMGGSKTVVINGLPDKYSYEGAAGLSFKDKIYLLDKIKDSFMHLNEDETLYDFDFDEKIIIIKNTMDSYSLKCKIPLKALYLFNRCIKLSYDNSSPSLKWIDDFLYKYRDRPDLFQHKLAIKDKNLNLQVTRFRHGKRIIFAPNTDLYIFYEPAGFLDNDGGFSRLAKDEYDSYHTKSYVALLLASKDEMNYSLLESLYKFSFHCEHPAYVSKMSVIMKDLNSFYDFIVTRAKYIDHDSLKQIILKQLYTIGQNGKEKGLLVDISTINNMIVKKYMRNARSHANNKGLPNSSIGNEEIKYSDVLYNSSLSKVTKKTLPTFTLFGRRKNLNKFFDEITKCSLSSEDLYNQIVNDLYLGKDDAFELFLSQLDIFIKQASKDKIEGSKRLKKPVGNASDFVDLLRKTMNGSFEYETDKVIEKKTR